MISPQRRERQQRDDHRELVGVDDPDRVRGLDPELARDRRQRDRHGRGIENGHGNG
jgi:hypothetical protein